MASRVLITGASGLLGRSLVAAARAAGLQVLAQCHSSTPADSDGVSWRRAAFDSASGIKDFLERNAADLAACHYLIHAYGPISCVDTEKLTGADFERDFHGNVVTAAELFRFLRERGKLRAAVFIGFDDAGRGRPFRKVLPYAAAKNALLLMVRSWAAVFPRLRINMVSPTTIAGAVVTRRDGLWVPAERVAGIALGLLLGRTTGRHRRVLR